MRDSRAAKWLRAGGWAALLATTAAHGAWGDRTLGEPLLQVYNRATVGFSINAWTVTQDASSGAIWVGTDSALLRFDGTGWENIPLGRGLYVRSIHVENRNLVWFGTSDDVGFAQRVNGRWQTVSLRERWPEAEPAPSEVHGTFRTGAFTDFVSAHRLVRWDGEAFRFWNYTTASRLFPLVLDGVLWFHHRESGLYRVTENGPELVAPATELPTFGLMGLWRDEHGLVGVSNAGVRRVGPAQEELNDAAAASFLATHIVSAVARAPDGHIAVGTLHGGIGILSPTGKLLRRIDASHGLVGNLTTALLCDRENYFWHCANGAITRFPAIPAVTGLPLSGNGRVAVNAITAHEGRLWSASDRGIFRLHDSGPPLAVVEGKYDSIIPFQDGFLLGRYGGADWLRGVQVTPVMTGKHVFGILPQRETAGEKLYLATPFQLSRAEFAEGKLATETLADLPATAASLVEDEAGRVWLGLMREGVRRFDPQRRALDNPTPPDASAAADNQLSVVVRAGAHVHLFIADRHYVTTGDEPPRASALTLPGTIVNARASLDARRIYAVVARADVPLLHEGLVALELDAAGHLVRVRDLKVPELSFAGRVRAMEIGRDAEHELLWIAGNEGVLRLRPDELAEWQTPAPPFLDVVAAAGAETAAAEFRYGGPHLTLTVKTTETAVLPTFRFQTRLQRDGTGDWSPPSSRAVFEISNLIEGSYTFATRALNPAGQLSEPVYYSFRVLPPWYRSNWAYGAYALGALLGGAGIMFYRERRSRRRTRQLETLVRERTAQLEKASAAKDEFLASMSHEIRNPMNGVVGLSAAIDISPLDSEAQRRFAMLRHCAVHLSTLLEDILDFSRLETGRVELNHLPFSPAELLDSVSAITASDSVAVGIPVEVGLSPMVPTSLAGDARRIRQILLNFVGNALKYAGRGQVEITVWSRPAAEAGYHEVTFAVSDEGPGVPLEEQERIFEKFERGASARGGRVPGTGMGLAVCRMLGEKMGGRVWVESSPGRGATFYLRLTLPAAAETPPAAAPALSPVLKWALVVDDEEYNCIALAATLEQLGFRARMERDPHQALALAGHQPFDVVFLDYDMPGMTGPELARRLRATPSPQGEPPIVIATTAYSTEEKRRECLAAGMDGFLAKPVTSDRIAFTLQQVLRTRAPAGVHYPSGPFAPADRWENFQRVAEKRGTDVATQAARFLAEGEQELVQLLHAIDAETTREATATAHRLAGRFAFVHSRTACHLATKLEQCAQRYEWQQARELHTELTRHWAEVRAALTDRPSAPAG